MSIDKLQKKIRKLKSPIMVDFSIWENEIVPFVMEQEGAFLPAYEKVASKLLDVLAEYVAAVRFDFDFFAIYGAEGLALMDRMMALAKDKGYFVLLEGLNSDKPSVVQAALNMPCDGLGIMPYLGSDLIKSYAENLIEKEKSLFVTLRTPNRSASEVQDLMTGSRLVHQSAADILNRLGEPLVGKCGYTQIAGAGAANAPDSLRHLRTKYNRLFLLVDGYDYSNANAKNCSFAFDQFGHGAIICAGSGITAAWKDYPDEEQFAEASLEAVRRMQKNILRYITIL